VGANALSLWDGYDEGHCVVLVGIMGILMVAWLTGPLLYPAASMSTSGRIFKDAVSSSSMMPCTP